MWLSAHVMVLISTGSSMSRTCSPTTRSVVCLAGSASFHVLFSYFFMNLQSQICSSD